MHKFKLDKGVFSNSGEVIMVTFSARKQIGNIATAGTGRSRSHAGTGPVKYSAVGKALDYILINSAVRCLEGDNSVYVEYSLGSTSAQILCDGLRDSCVGERLHGSEKFIPLILFHLRSNSKNDELKECYRKIKEEIATTGTTNVEDVARFCDCFYYTVAKGVEYEIGEHELQIETVKAAIRSGQLRPFNSPLDGLEPSLYAEEAGVLSTENVETSPTLDADPFSAIKRGDKVISYAWKEEQKTKIPSLKSLDDFVPCPEFYSILNKVCVRMNKVNLRLDAGIAGVDAIGKDYVNLFMVGKPGTGKTTLGYALGAATGMPVYSIPLNKDSESDVFQGMTKVVDGQLQFVATDFLDAYKNGGIVILEEINLANPNIVMGTIGQSIEYPFVLMENGYKPIRRHPLCVIIGTMNVGTYGSAGLNEALSSRFKTTYVLDDPADDDFIHILEKSGGTTKACKWILNVYKKLLDFLMSPKVNAEDICMRLTMRGCIGALEAIEEGENPKQAIRRTLIGKIAESDMELAKDAWEAVKSLPDMR